MRGGKFLFFWQKKISCEFLNFWDKVFFKVGQCSFNVYMLKLAYRWRKKMKN